MLRKLRELRSGGYEVVGVDSPLEFQVVGAAGFSVKSGGSGPVRVAAKSTTTVIEWGTGCAVCRELGLVRPVMGHMLRNRQDGVAAKSTMAAIEWGATCGVGLGAAGDGQMLSWQE